MNALALIPAYTPIDPRLAHALQTARVRSIVTHGCSDLPRARSQLLSQALAMRVDVILTVDADMVPTPDQIKSLIEHPCLDGTSGVSGVYALSDGRTAYTPCSATDSSPVRKAYAAGLGFAAVTRASLERAAAQHPEVTCAGGAPFFPLAVPLIVDGHYIPEDSSFWYRLAATGTRLLVDTRLVVGHVKTTVIYP